MPQVVIKVGRVREKYKTDRFNINTKMGVVNTDRKLRLKRIGLYSYINLRRFYVKER